jgi:hypothetical protein
MATGLLLYINGALAANSGFNQDYSASGAFNRIIIGTCLNATTCAVGMTQIGPSQFQGKIDEVRIYSRALSNIEISTLANP